MLSDRRYREIFRNRQFALLWSGQAISLFGDGILLLALPLLVISTHHTDAELGLVVAARVLPMVALLLFGGAITDRVSRRIAMLVADLARGFATLALGLLALSGSLDFGLLIVGAVILGTFDALFLPASTAMIPDIVATDQLPAANGLVLLSRTLAPLLGPVVAGVVTPSSALFIDAATFGVSSLFLAFMHPTARPQRRPTSMRTEIAEGLRFCRRTPWVFWTLIFGLLANALVFMSSLILVVLLLTKVIVSPHWQIGLVVAAGSLGGAIGAVLAGRLFPRRRVLVMWCVWIVAAGLAALRGVATSVVEVASLFFFVNVLLIFGSVVWESLLQAEVPRDLLGRVSSVDWFVSLGLSPIGIAWAGAVAGIIGVRPTLIIPAIVVTVVGSSLLLLVPSIRDVDRGDHADLRLPNEVPEG